MTPQEEKELTALADRIEALPLLKRIEMFRAIQTLKAKDAPPASEAVGTLPCFPWGEILDSLCGEGRQAV